jgi:hypothetical protein
MASQKILQDTARILAQRAEILTQIFLVLSRKMRNEIFPCLNIKPQQTNLGFCSPNFKRQKVEYSEIKHGVLHKFEMLLGQCKIEYIYMIVAFLLCEKEI